MGTKVQGVEEEKEETEAEEEIPAEEEEGKVLDAATIAPPEPGEETEAPQSAIEEPDEEEPHEEIFVNHVNRPDEEPDDRPDEDNGFETAEGLSKSESADEHRDDYAADAESLEASAAEENEGEIEPVAPPENGGQTAEDIAAEAAEENEGGIEPVSPEAATEGEPAQALQAARPSQKWVRRKHYKIQEVIKRRQIILVQVVKEERGNKGAALTTYLSLAGRYCVLMPNTPRGGGISRKITNAADRKRLKSAAQGLELPEGMGLIIRTAGENRSKLEIRRDYEYLMRLWDTIREKTLNSNAPARVYEEGDLIKRVIRDLYTKDVQDVVVEGEQGYRNAKEFMRMLMPGHSRNVHRYRDSVPLFQRMHIEAQLDGMFSPTVTLRSGGYIVINQTEALVSIDVNSGRATREHSIEETARKTNLEAADEIARQLRLRDLAGLIVIDFIDMEDGRNDREVEKRLRDAVKNDRARVQIGKISQFGLLEMSRQRLRAGVLAGSTVTCPHCGGAGIVRSVESTALRLLRALEEEGEKNRASAVIVRVASDIALYALNQKRRELARIETEYGMDISFEPREGLQAGNFELERTRSKDPGEKPRTSSVGIEAGFVPSDEPDDELPPEDEEEEEVADESGDEAVSESEGESQGRAREEQGQGERTGRRRRRRGGRGRGRDRDRGQGQGQNPGQGPGQQRSDSPEMGSEAPVGMEAGGEVFAGEPVALQPAGDNPQGAEQQTWQANGQNNGGDGEHRRRRRRRRGRRGGRDRNQGQPPGEAPFHQDGQQDGRLATMQQAAASPSPMAGDADRFGHFADEIDTTPRAETANVPGAPSAPVWSLKDDIPDTTPQEEPPRQEASKPAKKGWWQRTFSGG